VRGAFVVADPGTVAGKHVLIIDDIFTSGATARSVAQALVRAGVASVWVATLARAYRALDHRGNLKAVYRGSNIPRIVPVNSAAKNAPTNEQDSVMDLSRDQPSF
jgi:hypoxanthine-guanine phosphoribosyltransferase